LALEIVSKRPQPPQEWEQVAEHLRQVSDVEAVAMADQPLLGPVGWNNLVSINGGPPNGVLVDMLSVSPGWLETMKIPLLDGRDFVRSDRYPGTALVNQTFARTYLHGESPVGRTFEILFSGGTRRRFQAVGLVGDARYRNLREPIPPQVYVPFYRVNADGTPGKRGDGTLLLRTAISNPLTLVKILRQEVPRARPEFRVTQIRRQLEINQSHTVRERLLATLAVFFSVVALLLAGVGLYGVLHYYVLQRWREIGIRIAVGARGHNIARLVTANAFTVVVAGAIAGLALGMLSARLMESVFYEVNATDPPMLLFPSLALFSVVLVAALPAVIRAIRIDPVTMLRAE
jgi:hypothetical protein